MLKLEELEEGEYETEFGSVSVARTDGGYKIVVYIDEKASGKSAAKQILQEFLTAAGGEKPV